MLRSPTMVFSVARVYAQCATGAMIAHCWSAAPPFAVRRTWLNISRFGPTDTSYHDMNHRPGTSSFMSSCHRPPFRHASEAGSRCCIMPPVSTGIRSAKMPRGPPTLLRMSCVGRCHRALSQSTGGMRGARSNSREAAIRSACGVSFGNIGRT